MFGENGMKRTASALGFCLLFTLQAITLSAQSTDKGLYETDEEYADRMAAQSASVSEKDAVMHSSSYINWTKDTFSSEINLNVQKAGIPLPSGKSAAINRIQMDLPVLIKDPLLSIYVDDTRTIGDLVVEGSMTLDEITRIIAAGKQTPAYFAENGIDLQTKHLIKLQDLGAPLVKHTTPYTLKTPIEHIASRAYTGIIIDARGSLPIHGEFTTSEVSPCLFPCIYNEDMDLIYERNMVDPSIAKKNAIVYYGSDDRKETYISRVGKDPLWITAKKVYGVNRCDPVISHDDYLRIATVPENLKLLAQGKVVILLDKAQLEHAVSAPERNKRFYLEFLKFRQIIDSGLIPDTVIIPSDNVFKVRMLDLKFVADSAQLLPEEKSRITTIASSLKDILKNNDYTILVEGHTADVNKPNGQLLLSIQRAQAIIDALVAEGLDRSLFTYKGYGGTLPIADNSTSEGRAQNRRVEITIMPKSSYIQRK
jgi:outer membrane protein OmpA-like peptidoglycan-associated protein